MDKWYKWKVLLIISLVALSIWKAYPLDQKINLGLDLQGGMQLLLEVDVEKVPAEHRDDATERVVEVVRNRIDEFGVREPAITKQGSHHVVVQLPGLTDRERAKEIVGKTAHLEFKLVSEDSELIKKSEEGNVPEGYEYKETKNSTGFDSKILLHQDAALTGDHLSNASVGFDQYGQSIVQLQFDNEGAKKFDQVTFQNIGKQLAIVLDGKVHSAPVIRDRIPNGQAQISGNFTADEASDLALVLRAGALPAPVHIIEERSVGPSLGRDSIESGVKAVLIGGVLVFIFMPLYYLLAGLIADIGLLVYITLVVGSMALLGSSLTLPGIAGFILSVGMAVDANVLINERIREELQSGKTPRAAISAGYHRALSAIIDSNVTTLITSILLFFFGTGPVKGFAVTLTIGLLACMFSSLTVTRVVFDFMSSRNPKLNLKMMQWIGATNIGFLKNRIWAYGFSVITLAIGIASFAMRGNENFGVEFTGGTAIQIQFNKVVEASSFRSALMKEGVTDPSIQTLGDQNRFLVKTKKSDTKVIEKVAGDLVGAGEYQVLQVDEIGPAVSGDLKNKALWAVFWSAIGILVYLAFRFEWYFALAAVAALLHDTLFTFGVYALSGREINLPIVAAILTIMGYSVNDTIVNFDRVRENIRSVKKKSFKEIVELSINQTLSRTLLTSLTVLFAAFALFFFGGEGINDFAFCLCVGFGIGIYSTIFVASALLVDWKSGKTPQLKSTQQTAKAVSKK